MTARRSSKLVAVTRRRIRELPETFDDLAAAALRLAELADAVETPPAVRVRAVVEWRAVMDAISTRAGAAARGRWGSARPHAV